jgi:hypothetical protein
MNFSFARETNHSSVTKRYREFGVVRRPRVWATHDTGKDGPVDSQGAT